MAKNNNAKLETSSASEETANFKGTQNTDKKAFNNKSSSRRNSRSRSRRSNSGFKNSSDRTNETLNRMTISTPATATTLVFPTDSAAMASFGNFITTAGQDNFIENFNQVKNSQGLCTMTIEAEAVCKRTPNAMMLELVPLFGATEMYSASWLNPLQTAALNLKQYIDTSFGTNTHYDPQDLMLYLMASAAVFPMIAEIKRDLRLAVTSLSNTYPQFVPRGLYALLGIADDQGNYANGEGLMYTVQNLRSFIDQLNVIILQFNALPKPPEIAMFGYNDDFFDYIYTDGEDPTTSQLYVFRNQKYWLYEPDLFAEQTRTGIVPMPSPLGRSIAARLLILNHQVQALTALRTSDTAMLQNLFNAYGSRDTVQIPLMDFGNLAPLEFRFDPNMLITIENANVCVPGEVEVSDYVTVPATNSIEGSLFIRQNGDQTHCAPMFNLPLQFHKPYDQISQQDIGYALRLHPAFLNHQKAHVSVGAQDSEIALISSSAFTGFAALTGVTTAWISDTGAIATNVLSGRAVHSGWEIAMFSDFAAAPIQVDYRHTGDWSTAENLTLVYYTAARDVEVTYRLEDMAMHWVYLTQTVWAGNVNRNVTGSRS